MFGLKFPENNREHTTSYYAATSMANDNYPALEGQVTTDVAVVGGGFSGVNTALELSERGYEVTLLEANRLAWGASGRNGGQVIGGIGHDPNQFSKFVGDEGVRAIYDMGIECVEIIRERVAEYNIDCDLRWGYCDVALKPRHLKWFENSKKEQEAIAYPHPLTLLDRDSIKDYVDSDAYLGGLYNATGAGHLHPMNLCLGEAKAASAQGAQIFEQSAVVGLEMGERVSLFTENGCVNARVLVLCGNAYLGNLAPELAQKMIPASTCVIATEPLKPALASKIMPGNVAVCDPRTALDYFRLTSDRRLLFGGLSNYTGLVPKNYPQVMQKKMLRIFPDLESVGIDFAWDGQMGIGINRMPQLGKLADNVYFMQAYAGHGVAPTHIMARIIAEAIAGHPERFKIFASIEHRAFPGGRYLRRPGMALGMLYYKALDYF
ncbi:MAG TPA: FAD-binding oxidoreductase [Gammaproteobacteria bacterium]|nr:FAD-binding oxidoreductase [Gammaproteobacteria bacterium]HIK71106.1 FAD-binding oxidoreductase [Pseudomonadales bacterium]